MDTSYDTDLVAWAHEQAALLRSRQFAALDIANLAEEIDAVARAEQRELGSRVAVLLAHLLKWQLQPARRSNSWLRTIRTQRRSIERLLKKMPSLGRSLADADWLAQCWDDATDRAAAETGLDDFPEQPVWTVDLILDPAFFPE